MKKIDLAKLTDLEKQELRKVQKDFFEAIRPELITHNKKIHDARKAKK